MNDITSVTCIFAALMKQACEKIDKVREVAGSSFVKLLYNTLATPLSVELATPFF